MTWSNYLQSALAFGFVLALIAVAALLARRFGLGHVPRRRGERRLFLNEAVSLDARHKLVLIRRDDVEHLVLLGPSAVTVLETGIGSAPRSTVPASTFAASLAEASE